jgi:DNA-binding NarL/FixJ family response regulator
VLQEEFDILSAVQDRVSALQAITELKPTVVILDISMPKMGGIEVAHELKKLKLSSKIVFISMQNDPGYIQVLTAMGASYVLKTRIRTDLVPAIQETLNGRVFVSPR